MGCFSFDEPRRLMDERRSAVFGGDTIKAQGGDEEPVPRDTDHDYHWVAHRFNTSAIMFPIRGVTDNAAANRNVSYEPGDCHINAIG